LVMAVGLAFPAGVGLGWAVGVLIRRGRGRQT
jgi:hypothetical protein